MCIVYVFEAKMCLTNSRKVLKIRKFTNITLETKIGIIIDHHSVDF